MKLIDIYYDLSEIMDDDLDVLIDAIKEFTSSKKKKLEIRRRLEGLNLKTLDKELNELYDVEIKELKKYCFQKQMLGIQTSIYDFLD